MSLHNAAKHLASKGRNGDTTLVHMTEGEVAGLQALAKRHGTSLTINPHTGLPEAFGLKQLLPMAAGAALVASGVGAPLAAGIVGGGTFLATGSLQQGLMAGLGAYGGAGLAGMAGLGAGAAGTQAMAGEAAAASETAAAAPVADAVATPVETIQAGGSAAPATQQYAGAYQPTSFSAAPADTMTATQAYAPTPTQYGAFGEAPAPLDSGTSVADATQQNAAASYGSQTVNQTPKPTFMDNVAANKMQTAQYGLAAAAPLMVRDQNYAAPEIKGDADMGQRYAFESGYDNSVPGRTGPASYTKISNEEAKKLYGFAEGGEIGYPGEPVVRMASGGSAGYTGNVGDYSAADAAAARGGYGLGIDYSGYDTAPNVGIAAAAPAAARAASVTAPAKGFVYDPVSRTYVGGGTDAIYQGGGQYGKSTAELQAELDAQAAASAAPASSESYAYAAQGGLMQSYAQGGMSTLGSYSDGGRLLKGPGDGMSDNIPATIGRKQPARLADGEFVVPADVVSHLGNGSTDAGAKQLYKMMDKIRQARTGRKSQGKQINPNKFVPA